MTRHVVLVELHVKLDDRSAFERLIRQNAAASLAHEPGCRQFDVLSPESPTDGRFVLYEIYADAAAFDAHLRTEHFRQFDAATSDMVTQKTITRLRFAEP